MVSCESHTEVFVDSGCHKLTKVAPLRLSIKTRVSVYEVKIAADKYVLSPRRYTVHPSLVTHRLT